MSATRPPIPKEAYFTPQDLAETARAMRTALPSALRPPPKPFEPPRSALLVLDMQDYFLHPESHAFIPAATAIIPGIQQLIRAYQQRGLPVAFTRHTNTPSDAGGMSTWWRDIIDPASPLSEITPQLDRTGATLVQKHQYDAFLGTSLQDELRQRSVQQVVLSGVMTHLCCETTARSAFMRGFQVFFLVDGTATYNADFHRASLLNLSHGFATLSLVDEIRGALEEGQ